MAKVLIIGAGGVGKVVAYKCAEVSDVFSDIMLASRTLSKCDSIAQEVALKFPNISKIKTARLDADIVEDIIALIQKITPNLVINVALPYQDLTIMEACLQTGVHYLDTANYEPKEEAKFEYKWQWAYHEKFKEKGIMALLGCGFDPGQTQIYTSYAAKHHFDEIQYLDIVDCNGGDHGKAFATNFNPEINIREITQNGKYWENGKWIEVPPMSIHQPIEYHNIGIRESYLLYHEELESLTKNFPTLRRARFWMTFGEEYITHLRVMQNIGITSINPVMYKGVEVIPIEFLTKILPKPESLGENYTGETSIGCYIKGLKDNKEKTYFIWNNCKHQDAYKDTKSQGVSYTTGVPAMLGAKLMLTNKWMQPGVFNTEQMNPDFFMNEIGAYGLPWNENVNAKVPFKDY